MRIRTVVALAALFATLAGPAIAQQQPVRARDGMVVSQNELASQAGAQALREGGTAIDAAIATAFVLAVTHPTAGNIGGGGFIVFYCPGEKSKLRAAMKAKSAPEFHFKFDFEGSKIVFNP